MSERMADAGLLLLLQLEIPMDSVLQAATIARKAGCAVLLNPVPARSNG